MVFLFWLITLICSPSFGCQRCYTPYYEEQQNDGTVVIVLLEEQTWCEPVPCGCDP